VHELTDELPHGAQLGSAEVERLELQLTDGFCTKSVLSDLLETGMKEFRSIFGNCWQTCSRSI
jgi:hypothetical protein